LPSIEIVESGRIDERDSAFPLAVQLPGGDVLCSFSVGGGANVTGGSDWARSVDGGRTWQNEGTLLPFDTDNQMANFLKLTLGADGETIYAYGSTLAARSGEKFGHRRAEAIFCTSRDGGRNWSEPRNVPMPVECPLEVSHGMLPLASGRLLAPAATLPDDKRLGEQVIVAISDDGGETWPEHGVVFHDPDGRLGFFEQKLAQLAPGRLMATAWTVTLGDYVDQTNSFCISLDDGATWSPAQSTGIQGQTLTPVPLGGDRLLVLYNRRYGDQGIVMALVTFTDESWTVHNERLLYDAKSHHQRSEKIESGIDELDGFQFGFPTAIPLIDGTFLSTHWSVERGTCGIRWTRLRIAWPQ